MRSRAFICVFLAAILAGCTLAPAHKATNRTPVATAGVALASNPGSVQSRGMGSGNGGLPPGIAKNLAVGKPLPPGIAKQYVTHDVLLRLPPLRDGYEYIVVAGKILLVEIATQLIHDILVDVLFD